VESDFSVYLAPVDDYGDRAKKRWHSMKAKDFDQKFEAGEDLTPYLDLSQAKRLGSDQLRSGHDCEGLAAMTAEAPVIHSDPEILGGTPVFVGTRVPIKNLLDYLEAGDSLDEFLDHFPSVGREQAIAAITEQLTAEE
jgi:uncharacterized protein (DUF433 family)